MGKPLRENCFKIFWGSPLRGLLLSKLLKKAGVPMIPSPLFAFWFWLLSSRSLSPLRCTHQSYAPQLLLFAPSDSLLLIIKQRPFPHVDSHSTLFGFWARRILSDLCCFSLMNSESLDVLGQFTPMPKIVVNIDFTSSRWCKLVFNPPTTLSEPP